MTIGVFDSRIGGLTVLRELIKKYPNKYIYFGDCKNAPYGDKSINELKALTNKSINFLLSKKVDMIIIACGTISSNLYEYIKNKYNITIIDILTPTVRYIKENNINNLALLATSKTIESGYFQSNIKNIKTLKCPKLVPMIENSIIDENIIKEYVQKVDGYNVIMGCTHFPIIEKIFKKYSTSSFINMGKCLTNYLNVNKGKLDITIYLSKVNDSISNSINSIIDEKKKVVCIDA